MASDRAARRREILDSSGTKYRLLSDALKLANTPRSSGCVRWEECGTRVRTSILADENCIHRSGSAREGWQSRIRRQREVFFSRISLLWTILGRRISEQYLLKISFVIQPLLPTQTSIWAEMSGRSSGGRRTDGQRMMDLNENPSPATAITNVELGMRVGVREKPEGRSEGWTTISRQSSDNRRDVSSQLKMNDGGYLCFSWRVSRRLKKGKSESWHEASARGTSMECGFDVLRSGCRRRKLYGKVRQMVGVGVFVFLDCKTPCA